MNSMMMRQIWLWILLPVALMAFASCGGPVIDEPTEEVGGALAGDPCTTNAQCNDGNPCTIDKCVQRKCVYTNKVDGTSCSDGNACTRTDACQAGRCVGGPAVVCAPPNQCQIASGCNPSSGRCVYQAKAGSACDDGNSCTQNDRCTSAAAGVCKGAVRPNRSACDDGNPNTVGDVCASGACVGIDHCADVICALSDQCHVATCDHTTGICLNPSAANGTACDDGNPNTSGDTCTGGSCAGDLNECLTNNGGCSVNATCTNTPGSRTCACNPGFAGDGMSCAPVGGGEDATAPALRAFSLMPAAVNTTGGPVSVTASFTALDDLSGVVEIDIGMVSPSGNQRRPCTWIAPQPRPLMASASCVFSFPQFGEGGTWHIDSVFLQDAVGNSRVLSQVDLQAAGFATTVIVVSNQDSMPPALTAFSLTPAAIDTTGGPSSVTASFTALDDLSGIVEIDMGMVSPSGSQRRPCTWIAPQPRPLVASASCVFSFPQFGEGGTWHIDSVFLQDAVGNSRGLVPGRPPGRWIRHNGHCRFEPRFDATGVDGIFIDPSRHRYDGGACLRHGLFCRLG